MTMHKSFSRVLLVSCLTLAMGLGTYSSFAQAQAATPGSRVLPDFTDLVEQVGPSVVNIRTLEKVTVRDAQSGTPDEEMQELFRRFFGVPMPAPTVRVNNVRTVRNKSKSNPKAWALASSCQPMVL